MNFAHLSRVISFWFANRLDIFLPILGIDELTSIIGLVLCLHGVVHLLGLIDLIYQEGDIGRVSTELIIFQYFLNVQLSLELAKRKAVLH